MIAHHPEKSLLVDYSAGNMSFGPAMCVTAHLEHCQRCQRELQGMTTLGAVLMEQQRGTEVSPDLLDQVMQRIESEDSAAMQTEQCKKQSVLDKFVPRDLASIDWRGIGDTLKSHEIDVGDPSHFVTLIRMRRGGTVPKHTHKGQEITLVLQGGFSDASGSYQVGDFVECTSEIEHQPVANQNEDCICLTSRSAPIKFTGPFMRTLNPFVRR
ncbi:MAG: ChrR family anti-sigma-E factor [Pseudomonadales bacterium]